MSLVWKNLTGPYRALTSTQRWRRGWLLRCFDALSFVVFCVFWSVEDAVNMALHVLLQHLNTARTYARILFVDFSSAFNTIIPALLQDKLSLLHVPDSTCRWIPDFLSDRKQHVSLGKHVSDPRTISTGSPQGCIISPLLFSL